MYCSMRKICVITNNRADYSRLKTLLRALKERQEIELLLFVIGSHLLSNYGETIKEIEKDGFTIAYRMHTEVEGRVPVTMAKSTGTAITELANAFYNFRPDIVVVHGDRYEALAAATAASLMNIFVAHIQGGEVTGTIDEHIRHAITKLAHIHFPSTEEARERIIKLGEQPARVFNHGCPSSDVLLGTPRLSFKEVKKQIRPFTKKPAHWLKKLNKDFFLVIQHPVTTEFNSAQKTIQELLNSLRSFANPIIMLWPNIDAGAEILVHEIKRFHREEHPRMGILPNFPLALYINIMRHARVMIGNSSSGVREACYFGIPVVNIGTRQAGRERGKNVVDVPYGSEAIKAAIKRQLEARRYEPEYLYGRGKAGENIAATLATIPLGSVQKRITF